VGDKPITLGLVSARGGSASIRRKNIVPVAGKPLLAYTVEAAQAAGVLDRLVVSTDDSVIGDVARALGAEVPFTRPPELARDDTPGIEPVLHAIDWLDKHEGYRPDFAMLLQPTSPLRSAEDIRAAVDLARELSADSVVSVVPVDHHPYWMKRLMADGRMRDFIAADKACPRRQDLPPAYALNGAVYLARCDVLREHRSFYTDNTYAYVMPPERSLDVDSGWDLYLVELVLRNGYHEDR